MVRSALHDARRRFLAGDVLADDRGVKGAVREAQRAEIPLDLHPVGTGGHSQLQAAGPAGGDEGGDARKGL